MSCSVSFSAHHYTADPDGGVRYPHRWNCVADELDLAGWDAEDYHQLYLHNNPGGYECPAHYVRGFPDLK